MAHGQRVAGVLYESDEWSDHKLAAELERALAASGAARLLDDEASAPERTLDAASVLPQGAAEGKGAGASCWDVRLIDMERLDCIEQALECDLLVSRVFASAQFRGHGASLRRMGRLVEAAEAAGIPLVNPGCAHRFEVDKRAATEALGAAGLMVPAVYACGLPDALLAALPDAGSAASPEALAASVPDASKVALLAASPDAPASAPPGACPEPGMAFPAIIKPNCGGRTTHTAIVQGPGELAAFLADAPAIEFIVEEYVEPERGFVTRVEVVGGQVALVVRRSIAEGGLSAYHLGSTYELYGDVPSPLRDEVLAAAAALGFRFGSFDIIETARGNFFIDANSVSNVSEDCADTFGMDLMAEYAKAIVAQELPGG